MQQSKPKFKVVTVCGVGMGSSLILKMTAEDAFRDAGIQVSIEHSDLGSVKSMDPDIIIAQSMHSKEVVGLAPIIISVFNFLDKEHIKNQALKLLSESGMISL